ncbi:MAG: lysine--tRNA ligase [Patescibacteria group bacterium]|nr:lysine--tRNA ligase [Patescibacteria group bacterium]
MHRAVEFGINPYPQVFDRPQTIAGVLAKRQVGDREITIAGRLLRIRTIGKLVFADVHDGTAKMQIQIDGGRGVSLIGEGISGDTNGFENFCALVDTGDFILVTGEYVLTKTQEKTILVRRFQLLAKALRPLPEKWHGLRDLELRYRKRYLDVLSNAAVRQLFEQRTRFIKSFRDFLDQHGFLEVETPVLEQVPGGAEAEPFVTHHRTLGVDFYLRISLELHLKRLLVAGYPRVYEIGKVFRNEGMSTEHLQEFTMLEFYLAYADYEFLQQFVQDCYRNVLQATFQTLRFTYQGKTLDFEPAWKVVDYVTVVREATGVDVLRATEDELRRAVGKSGGSADPGAGRGRLIDLLYKKTVRPNMVAPTLLINHPVAVSPLAKRHRDNPELTERITVVVNGSEVGNGFSELNDPLDQRDRFLQQAKLRAAGDREAQMTDEDFLEALEHGMPPTAGFGVGIDRLFMLATDQPSVRDVVLFPLMRPQDGSAGRASGDPA